jgi:4-amino-4-deoxy-L-arabinose transferase-like glycosyltransferase
VVAARSPAAERRPSDGEARPGTPAWAGTLAVVLGGALWLLPGLGGYPLFDPSEARHAAVARHMGLEGRWLVPVLYGEPYYDKPAPFYWLLRAAAHLPASAEAAVRLPSVVATLLTALLLYRFALPRFGAAAAALGAGVFLTCPAVIGLARFANPDALLAACLTAAVVAWLRWLERPASPPWAAYAWMGAGSLVKGPVAIVLPLAVVAACAVGRGTALRRWRDAGLGRGIASSGAVLLAWLVPAAIADPAYARAFLLDHNVARYVSAAVGHPEPPWFLLPALAAMLLPWSLVLPAVAGRRPPAAGAGSTRERDLLLWAAAIVAFYSLGRAKLATYALPAVAPLALWLGMRLVRLAASPGEAPVDRWLRGALALWAAALVAAPAVAWAYLRLEFPRLAAEAWRLWPLPLLAVAGLAAAWREPRRLRATAAVFASGNAALALLVYLVGAPIAGQVASDATLARTASALAPGVTIVGFRIHPGSISFYSGAPVRKAREVEEVVRLADGGPLLVVTRAGAAAVLRQAGLPLHQWTECERHCLWGTIPRPGVAMRPAAASPAAAAGAS